MHGWVFCIEDNIRYDVNKNDLIARRPEKTEHKIQKQKISGYFS